ncbi:hypothetical protein D3C79_563900 [compost metagenome]
MQLDTPPGIDAGVRVGGFEDVTVFGGDRCVPVDQRLGRAVSLAVVAIEPLHQHQPAVIDRCGAVVDDVMDAAVRVHAAKASGERQVVAIDQVTLGDRRTGAGNGEAFFRVADRHAGFGFKAVIGFAKLIAGRLRLVEQAEVGLVHEGEMRVVERVFHHPQRAGFPLFVELEDAPVAGGAVFREVGDRLQRIVQRDPGIAILFLAMVGLDGRARRDRPSRVLRDLHASAAAVVFPAVVAAGDIAVFADEAFGQFGGAVAAAVAHRYRGAIGALPKDQGFTEQGEGFWPVVQGCHGQQGVPEASQYRLFGDQHDPVSSRY